MIVARLTLFLCWQKKGKKKFIDKKSATTFVVLSRGGSGDGPGDSGVGEKVFVPVKPPNFPRDKKWRPQITLDDRSSKEALGDESALLQGGRAGEVGAQVGNFRADDFSLGEYGFPDDGYDYSQHFAPMGGGQFFAAAHLGDVTAANRLAKGEEKKKDDGAAAPASQAAGTRAAPPPTQPDFSVVDAVGAGDRIYEHPAAAAAAQAASAKAAEDRFADAESEEAEVLRALESSDDDQPEDKDWVLNDDFLAAAQGKPAPEASGARGVRFADASFSDDDDDDSFRDDDDDDGESYTDSDEGFRGGHASSSRQGVTQFEERRGGALDDYLEHMMEREYNDEQLGEGPEELLHASSALRGTVFANDLGSVLDEYLDGRKLRSTDAYHIGEELDEEQKKKTLELAKKALEKDGDDDVVYVDQVVEDPQWDCASILSTYSNLANHPQVLKDDTLKPKAPKGKSAKPLKFADQAALDEKGKDEEQKTGNAAEGQEGEADAGGDLVVNKGQARPREETAEEKKARKAAIKEERRLARAAKKQLKGAYKAEASSQKRHVDSVPFYGKSTIPL